MAIPLTIFSTSSIIAPDPIFNSQAKPSSQIEMFLSYKLASSRAPLMLPLRRKKALKVFHLSAQSDLHPKLIMFSPMELYSD